MRNLAPEVRKQIFVGDEEFEEAALKQMQQTSGREVRHTFKRIVEKVLKVTGKNEREVRGDSGARTSSGVGS